MSEEYNKVHGSEEEALNIENMRRISMGSFKIMKQFIEE